MEIMEFCQKVKRNLMKDMEEGVKVSVKQVTKNNGVMLHSVTVSRRGTNISPNIYLDGLYAAYEQGETFHRVMGEVRRIYEESKVETSIDMGFFLDYEKMKEKVVYKVIGYERNKELLSKIPHILFLDMALVFYCHAPQKELGCATILIYNSHLKMWGISKEHLYWDARKNAQSILPAKILSMEEIMKAVFLSGLIQEDQEEEMEGNEERQKESSRMYVLGNERKLFGAAAMFYDGVLEEFSDKIKKSFFILPSSVHEVILLPDDGTRKAEDLWEMVCEINATQVEPEEVLTNAVYYFSIKCKKIKKLF